MSTSVNGAPVAVGQRVELNDGRLGAVRFIGTTAFQTGEWIGVELEESTGKNDGSVQGRRYFDCAPGYGIFCRASGVGRVLQEPTSKTVQGAGGTSVRAGAGSDQSGPNGRRRQTLQRQSQDVNTTAQGTTKSAGLPLSGMRSPVKSPTKQLIATATSSASTSRTSTPPVGTRRTTTGPASKVSRSSIAPTSTAAVGRRISTLASSSQTTATRQTQASSSSTAPRTTRTVAGPTSSSRTVNSVRAPVRPRSTAIEEEHTTEGSNEQVRPKAQAGDVPVDSAAQDGPDLASEDEELPIRNFAPPASLEKAEKRPDSRRPSSPNGAVDSLQRSVRGTAASQRQMEELQAKIRLLERKRGEDREVRQQLEKAEQERDQYKTIIEKLQNKYRPQQQEIETLKRELAEHEKRLSEINNVQAQHELDLEAALIDREYAEEQADQYKVDLEAVRQRNEELQLELDIAKEENVELGREMSPEERSSAGWLQLERNNERLRDALISLRDIAHDNETDLKEQIGGLEDQVKELEGLQASFDDTQKQLLRTQSDAEDLRQQLEVALNAEEMIESLTEDNQTLRDRLLELRGTIEDLENLRELSDELEVNHVEAEKQMQEEIDFKDSLLMERERIVKDSQTALDEAEYNISRFRELVSSLQNDLQDLQASKQITESEASYLSDRSRAMMELNSKLQTNAIKSRVKNIDLELRKLDAQQSSEHLAIVSLFLPEAFDVERDSVLTLLRVKRIDFKATLVHNFINERLSSVDTWQQDNAVFTACDALNKLSQISAMANRLANSISRCDAVAFAAYGSAFYELEVVERTLDDAVDALRKDELRESAMAVQLGRSIDVMTHLSSLHLQTSLGDHADDLIMEMQLLQNRMGSAASAFDLTLFMLEAHVASIPEDEEGEHEVASATAVIVNRLKASIETTRHIKVLCGKTSRALIDLHARQLTLEPSLRGDFTGCQDMAQSIAVYACESGTALQELFDIGQARDGMFDPVEVSKALSRVASTVFVLPESEASPYTTLAARLRSMSDLVANLATLPTDLNNTVEFESAQTPWLARASELKQRKVTSVQAEAELARTVEGIKERDDLVKRKEIELEEQSVRIEMLEARMKDASKRSARIAELEQSLRSAKEGESRARRELTDSRNQSRQEVDRLHEEMASLVEHGQRKEHGQELDANAMGNSVMTTLKRKEHRIAGLESAVRHLQETNMHLLMPPATATCSAKGALDWLEQTLEPSQSRTRAHRSSIRMEGEKALRGLLALASAPATVDLTKIPENKLAWRPAKQSSRWKVQWRNEEWIDWQRRRDRLVLAAHNPSLQAVR